MSRLAALFLSIVALALPANAAPNASAHSSQLSAAGTASVVGGSALILSAGAALVVESVETVADGVIWVLKNTAKGASVTVKYSGKAAGAVSVATGQVLTVTTEASGHVLISAGKALAFIPNEVGQSLLHQSKAE